MNANRIVNKGWKGKRTFHNLPLVEVNEKMTNGECFTCEEKYNPTHVCKNKQFKLMIIEEDQDEGEPRKSSM